MTFRQVAAATLLSALAAASLGCATSSKNTGPLRMEEIQDAERLHASVLTDRKLACNSCMSGPTGACESLSDYPFVAVVRGFRVVKDISPCNGLKHASPDDEILCTHLTSLRFTEAELISNTRGFDLRNRFRTIYGYNYWASHQKSGVHFNSSVGYLIYARPASDSIPPEAEWDIAAACPIADSNKN